MLRVRSLVHVRFNRTNFFFFSCPVFLNSIKVFFQHSSDSLKRSCAYPRIFDPAILI